LEELRTPDMEAETVLKVLESALTGPKTVIPDGNKTGLANKPTVWKIVKGHSRDDCIALEPLNNPGWYLRMTSVEVPVPAEPPAATAAEETISLGESMSGERLMNNMFTVPKTVPGQKGVIAYTQNELGASAEDPVPMTTIITVVLSQNDGSIEFLKESTWCMRTPFAASIDKTATGISLESMASPGFYIMRKNNDTLVGMGLGDAELNWEPITWQLVAPKYEICPDNCNFPKGICSDGASFIGTCKCQERFEGDNCGVLALWPTINETSAGEPGMLNVMKAVQALVADKGVPQDIDGLWNTKTRMGVMTWLGAIGRPSGEPLNGIAWEQLTKDVKTGMGEMGGTDKEIVKSVQRLLNEQYDYNLPETGVFDSKTSAAVSDFKKRLRIEPSDGVVDKVTWNALVSELPKTMMTWPVESSYQPFADEQLFYIRDERDEPWSQCKLIGSYVWDYDIPGRAAPSSLTQKQMTLVAQGGGEGIGDVKEGSQGIPSLNWKKCDDYNVCEEKVGQKALRFPHIGPYTGGYASCEGMTGFDTKMYALTVEMYFKPATIAQDSILFSTSDKNKNGFSLGYRGYSLRFGISAESWVETPVRFFEDTWHHVAAVFKGSHGSTGTLLLYLDGELLVEKIIPEKAIADRAANDLTTPLFGANPLDPTQYRFWGSIDKIRISRAALGPNEFMLSSENAGAMNTPTNFYVDKPNVKEGLAFSYSGEDGPSTWGSNYSQCNGESQSPIDLPNPADPSRSTYKALPATKLKYIEMDYHSTVVQAVFKPPALGWSIKGKGGELVMNDNHYMAHEATLHTPSEHTIAGLPTEMELQIRHIEQTTNRTAIVSIMFKNGAPNDYLEPIIMALNGTTTGATGANNVVQKGPAPTGTSLGESDLLDLIPFDPGFVTYVGSLTTPPCTENVLWVIVDKPITASLQQIKTVRGLVGDNARPLQDRNGREVRRISVGDLALARLTDLYE